MLLQKMKKMIKTIMFAITIIMFFRVLTVPVKAESVNEIESNDTMVTAQSITANNETPSGTVNGTFAGKHVINGNTSISDEDWFKVYLNEGTRYLSLNADYYGDTLYFEVISESNSTIESDTFTKSVYGVFAYELSIPSSGYYYVHIQGITTSSIGYLFMIGTPSYSVSYVLINCSEGTINMTSGGGTQTAHFDGTIVSSIPIEAIAYAVRLQGVGTNQIKSAQVTNGESGNTITLDRYTWKKEGLVGLGMPTSAVWSAALGYNKVASFTPLLRVSYVYPVYSGLVN